MEGRRFDEWARAVWTASGSRRGTLRVAGVGLAVASLRLWSDQADAAADCFDDGVPCGEDNDCCSSRCGLEPSGNPPTRRCLLSPGKKCKRAAQCGSDICKGTKKRKQCRCSDGQKTCGLSCCGDLRCCGTTCGECCKDSDCATGEICNDNGACVGNLQLNDPCDPAEQQACVTRRCGCIDAICTCRETICGAFNSACDATAECCAGACVTVGAVKRCVG